ncbi:DUF6843 domain-containing protein [Paenibacillus tyrfis]|uniref:DUF6843 domain-containing protein n=1 Tax=Paenibacillus tyrfis TaxID=1501230 RepID=UPI0020A08AB5|nr:hypothetical protein [Paenibacillus tyrfis]MCP1311352.1 hypothetical protein [Paenibacillus tyrfis]
MKSKGVIGLVAILTLCLVVGGIFFFNISERPTHKFLLPKGFTGWVEVIYEQPGYPALKKENQFIIYEVPSSGKIMTSSKNITGPMVFNYIEADGKRTDFPENAEMIHGLKTSSGGTGNTDGTTEKTPQKLTFFVGTKEKWNNKPTP